MKIWDEQNPFAALLAVMSRAELVHLRKRLARAECERTAQILDDEIAERDLAAKARREQ